MERLAKAWARRALVGTLILLGLAGTLPAAAVTLEQAVGALERRRRVYDFPKVLSTAEVRALNDQLATLENSGLAEPVVVLLDRAEGATVQEFALRLGERWGVGGARADNGLVFVADIHSRKTWLEVGRDLQSILTDTDTVRIQRETLVPEFRAGRYAAGLQALFRSIEQDLERGGGVEALARRPEPIRPSTAMAWLTFLLGLGTLALAFRAWPRGTADVDRMRLPTIGLGFASVGSGLFAAVQAPGHAAAMLLLSLPAAAFAGLRLFEDSWVPAPLEKDLDHRPVLLFGGLLAAGLLVWLVTGISGWILGYALLAVPFFFVARSYFHRVPRRCPECGGHLHWVREQDEIEFLKPAENVEQRLGSVNYDVWRCDKCRRSAVFNRGAGPAPLEACPKCHRHTLTRHADMHRRETEIITECHNPDCRYRDVHHRPRDEGRWGGWDNDGGFGGGGIVFIPPIFGGGWGGGGGSHGDSGGWSGGGDAGGWSGGVDAGDFGGFGGFDGGGGGVDW